MTDSFSPHESSPRLARLSTRYPVSVCMLFVSLFLLGFVSLQRIPLVLLPEVDEPVVSVTVPYPNATPEQVQETITKPLEEALSTIPGIQRISSSSGTDQSVVSLTFSWGEDLDWLRAEIRERIEQIRPELPEDVDRIMVQNFSTNDIPIIEGRISSGRSLKGDYDFLEAKIKKPLERVPGVAEVVIGGVEREEIAIDLRLDDLKKHRVNAGELFQRLDSTNLNFSLGRVREGEHRFEVLIRGREDSLEKLRELPIGVRGLRLEQLADITLREPTLTYGRHLNGEYAIALEIRKSSEANTVETVRRVIETIERLNQDPSLQGITVLVWHNSGEEITKSLSSLLQAGVLGAFLAVGVLYLFLRRLAATLIVSLAIPFSVIASVGVLYLLGNSLNVLSMMGLMLSTGMLVDNAVVVLESIYRHLEKGRASLQAAIQGTGEVMVAVLAATLTSIIIFVPLVFGRKTNLSVWLSHTGVAIMISLLCSLLISITLIPLAMARLRGVRQAGRTDSQPGGSRGRGGFTERYLGVVDWSLRHRLLVGLLIIPGLVGTSFMVLGELPDSSPDAQDLRDLTIRYEFTENYDYAKIERDYVNPVESYLFANRERFKIRDVYSFYEDNRADTRIYLDTERLRLEDLEGLRRKLAEELPVLPGAQIRLGRPEGGQSSWFGLSLYGEDPVTLLNLVREAHKRFAAIPEFTEIYTDLERRREEVQIVIDRKRAKRFGISPQSVGEVLGVVLRGRRLRGQQSSFGEKEIWVRLRPRDRQDLRDLRSIQVGEGPNGEEILLGQAADIRIARTAGTIRRENRRTYTSISLNYSGEKREEGRQRIQEVMSSLLLPEGYSWGFGFWTQREEKENQEFAFNLLLALFMVYFVMASLFESLSHPFAIMVSLLFAFVGVTWFLWLTGTPFNIMAQIGILILVGIVVNNGIVLLDHINRLRRAGLPRREAIQEGCRERLRPILMTAATTIVGLIPLAMGQSALLGLRYFPMARTLMGGLMAATVLTLLVLPTYYTLFDDFGNWLRGLWRLSGTSMTSPASPTTAPEEA